MPSPGRLLHRDTLLALLLFGAIVAYLAYLPRSLGRADESHFLYEAKRIRDGEVIYRDFFQFVTPGAPYAMAFLFWVFGTTIQTARIATAVLHGLTGVVMYATCRGLRIRPALAILPSIAFVTICQPAWQFASWHWFSTFFTMLVMLTMVRGPWASRPRWAFVPGLATGLLIAVQQQKGLAIGSGVGAIFVLDYLIGLRFAEREPFRRLLIRLLCYAAGVALVVIPLLASIVLIAGFQPVWDALVMFPLVNYRKSFRTTWGAVFWITEGYANYTFPVLLKYLPLALLPACLRAGAALLRGRDRHALRQLIVLIVSAASATLSIWYFPDFIHVAFVAPVYLIGAAEALHWVLGFIRVERPRAVVTGLVTAALLIALGLHLRRNALLLHDQYRYPHDTAFGRVDFPVRWEPLLIDRARELLAASPSMTLFAYPNTCEPYLTTGGRNPTPYQYFQANVSPRQHTENVLEILRTQPVPYIMAQGFFLRRTDPVAQVILEQYERVTMPELQKLDEVPTLSLYRRKSPPVDAAPAP